MSKLPANASTMMNYLTFALAGCLSIACTNTRTTSAPPISSQPSAPAEAPEPPAARLPTSLAPTIDPPPTEFGGDAWGFVQASTINGRFILLRRFSGADPPRFGQHGEASSPASLAAFDLTTGSERALDDWVGISSDRRWLLLIADATLWLVDGDTGTWDPLPGADMREDSNRCLPPRQAAFSPDGTHVGWVLDSGELRVRKLTEKTEWSLASDQRIWRGWPENGGQSAVLAELPTASQGWPSQRTSCACRWCGRFAASHGFYGWGGPEFTFMRVGRDGARTKETGPPDASGEFHGPSTSGCTLKPAGDDGKALERGPWHWDCAAN